LIEASRVLRLGYSFRKRLAVLQRDDPPDLLALLPDRGGEIRKQPPALLQRERPGEHHLRLVNRGARFRGTHRRHFRERLAVERIDHGEPLARLAPPSSDESPESGKEMRSNHPPPPLLSGPRAMRSNPVSPSVWDA